ncbi:MAG: toll/interleukin-1 receptor domain-containing protein [Terriglobia bacterium]
MSESSSSSGFTYRAFISYSHRDKAWADWLHRTLETYRVPSRLVGTTTAAGIIPRRLNPVFRDRDELSSSPELGSKINQALSESENLIVICSPASATSRWVNEEVLSYKRMGRCGRIFCLIVDGEPDATDIPGRESEECFCPALRFATDADGRPTDERVEPIAADTRPGKDGKPNAKLKLIAGMLGVGFDALKQRELQRRTRRMTAIAALALIVMTATSLLAVYALISRHEAVLAKQQAIAAQHQANIARRAAIRRQKQAEDLVGFMLGDLTTKLRQLDKLDILKSVDDKAMAYFKSLPLTDVDATTLAQRAKALQKIGDVRMNQTRLSDSMDAFQQALRINRELVRKSPDDPARQNAYGENLLWVGFNYWQQGKLGLTEDAFKQAAAALQKAAVLAPNANDVQKNLDDVYNNLGHVAEARGELDLAYSEFIKDYALDRRMAAQRPGDVLWQNALNDSYNNLGGIALARGQLESAIANFLKQQQLMARVVAQAPDNRQMQAQMLEDNGILARALALAGQLPAAIKYTRQAVNIGEGLVSFDPSHTDWQSDYGSYNRLLGGLLLEQGNVKAAGEPVDTGLRIASKLEAKDPGNAEWRTSLALAKLEGARLAMARRQFDTARGLASQASTVIQKLSNVPAPKANSIRIQAEADLLLGRLAAEARDADAANRFRQQALASIRPLAEHSADPRDLSIWVDALLATGDNARATPVIGKLQRMGYRSASFLANLRNAGIDYPEDKALSARIAGLTDSAATDAATRASNRPSVSIRPPKERK